MFLQHINELLAKERRLYREHEKYDAQIVDLENKISTMPTADEILKLKEERDACDQSITSNSLAINAVLEQYAQRECHKLTSLFYSKLPRELRDMVYKYMDLYVQKGPIIICTENCRRSSYRERGFEETLYDFCPAVRLYRKGIVFHRNANITLRTPMFDPAFVGKGMAQEVLRLYFSQNFFDICYTFSRDPETLDAFLGKDWYDIGIVPRQWIRNLRIRIKPELASSHSLELETKLVEERLRVLRSPSTMDQGTLEIMIGYRISVMIRSIDDPKLGPFLDKLRRPVCQLMKTRKVTVVHFMEEEWPYRNLSEVFASDEIPFKVCRLRLKRERRAALNL